VRTAHGAPRTRPRGVRWMPMTGSSSLLTIPPLVEPMRACQSTTQIGGESEPTTSSTSIVGARGSGASAGLPGLEGRCPLAQNTSPLAVDPHAHAPTRPLINAVLR
jgi:hypothetical protein